MCIRDRCTATGFRPVVGVHAAVAHTLEWRALVSPAGFDSRPASHWIAQWLEPVSYTHLDVYKRQVAGKARVAVHAHQRAACPARLGAELRSELFQLRRHRCDEGQRRFANQRLVARLVGFKPVSYTHLDVYKRQVVRVFMQVIWQKYQVSWYD